MGWFSSRCLFLYAFLSAVLVLAGTLYFQYVLHLAPCSLCIFQRVSVLGAGLIYGLAALLRPQQIGTRIYAGAAFVVVLGGLGIALRQVYLQSLPAAEVPACGPGLNFLFQNYHFLHALALVLKGSGDCATVHWRFLRLSLAGWSAIYFGLLTLLNIIQLTRSEKGK